MEALVGCEGMDRLNWRAVGDAVESCGNVLELYGLVDFPVGVMEAKILQRIDFLCQCEN